MDARPETTDAGTETAAPPGSGSGEPDGDPAAPPRAGRPRRGDELQLRVTDLAYGGRGIARDDGFVVFVSGGLPGDLVRARVGKSKRSYAEAQIVELVEPSPERVPYEGEPMPGAPWVELPYERQLEHKSEQTLDALQRIGRLDDFDFEQIEPAVSQWRYRNKFEYSFGPADPERPTDPAAGIALGFHAQGRWDEIVDVADNPLASAAVNAERDRIAAWAREAGLTAYDKRTGTGRLRNLVIREGRRTGQVQSRLVVTPGPLPPAPVDLLTTIAGDAGSTDGPTEVLGEPTIDEQLCGLTVRISGTAFFQTNTEMAERLYEIALDYADLRGDERVFDLYCGIGTIALTMAREAREVWGLEVVDEAIADAELNARLNRIENARFVAANARTGLRPLIEQAGQPDVVVVDPPRAGLSEKIVRRVLECQASRIVYVSCNPTTLAPNLAQMEAAGYKLRRVRPVDMFPQTPHIESVAVLDRV